MRSSGIGGQAVLEGVMMKNKDHYAVAIRKPDNQIEVKKDEFHSVGAKNKLFRLPLLRGVVVFVESLVLGIRTLTYSSSFYEEREEEGAQASKAKETLMDVGVVVLSVFMAVLVFILLPLLLSRLLGHLVHSGMLQLFLEGVLRIAMFVAYVAMIAKTEDVKRIFMYHGAEHKCINCVEHGEELTVANVRRQSRRHKCCKTSFLLVVMLISFVFFMFIRVRTAWLRYLLRIVLVPVIAGISYELIRLAENGDNKVFAVFGKPGLFMQGLTTREPDDSMVEVAIASVEAVFDWKAFQEKAGIAKKRAREKKREFFGEAGKELEKVGEVPKDELTSLDRLFDASAIRAVSVEEEDAVAAARENRETNVLREEEEEDEILRALDRFFIYEDTKGSQSEKDGRGNKTGGK